MFTSNDKKTRNHRFFSQGDNKRHSYQKSGYMYITNKTCRRAFGFDLDQLVVAV